MMTEQEEKYREERMVRVMVECNRLTYDCLTTAQVARRVKMTAQQLYQQLKTMGVLFRDSGIWMLTPKFTGMDLLRYRYTIYYTMEGERKVRTYPVWTQRGAEYIQCIMKSEE